MKRKLPPKISSPAPTKPKKVNSVHFRFQFVHFCTIFFRFSKHLRGDDFMRKFMPLICHSLQKKKAANPFIEVEAELSDEGSCSTDESEGSSLDDMDDSFIYTKSQCSQQDPDGVSFSFFFLFLFFFFFMNILFCFIHTSHSTLYPVIN